MATGLLRLVVTVTIWLSHTAGSHPANGSPSRIDAAGAMPRVVAPWSSSPPSRPAYLGCPQAGCSPGHTNGLALDLPKDLGARPGAVKSTPSLRWTQPAVGKASRCASTPDLILCSNIKTDRCPSCVLAALSAGDGSVRWNVSASRVASVSGVPLLGVVSESVVLDARGAQLAAFDLIGAPLGPTIDIVPALGATFSPVVTDNGVIVLVSRNSDVAGYLTTGVPHASIWLNASVDGHAGTFFPLAPPVVIGSRVLLLTQFQTETRPAKSMAPGTTCRLYAVDVHRTINNRMQIVWHLPVACPTLAQATSHARTANLPMSVVGSLACFPLPPRQATASFSLTCVEAGDAVPRVAWTTPMPFAVTNMAVVTATNDTGGSSSNSGHVMQNSTVLLWTATEGGQGLIALDPASGEVLQRLNLTDMVASVPLDLAGTDVDLAGTDVVTLARSSGALMVSGTSLVLCVQLGDDHPHLAVSHAIWPSSPAVSGSSTAVTPSQRLAWLAPLPGNPVGDSQVVIAQDATGGTTLVVSTTAGAAAFA